MSSERPAPHEAVHLVLAHALDASPTLGDSRLVCIDGPAGSGKTTLADALASGARRRVASVGLVHLDDLFEGWSGLGHEVTARIDHDILRPLAGGDPGSYRRWDWAAEAWAEKHTVYPVALLVLEGVGAAATAYDHLVTTRVWVDAPRDLRQQRGLTRGGEGMAENWERWLDAEQEVFAVEQTRSRADVVVDGTGATPPRLGQPPFSSRPA